MSTYRNTDEARNVSGLFVSFTLPRLKHTLLDLVFPPQCAGCGRVDYNWCPRCADALAAEPLAITTSTAFNSLSVMTTAPHSGWVRAAVHGLKYNGVRGLADMLSERLWQALQHAHWQVDTVVPVPMHANRMTLRGYNQAALLAQALADRAALPYRPDVLQREQDTRSQVGLGRAERLTNVQGAFKAVVPLPEQTVLLVDDVFTTGATLVGCAHTLLEAGVRAVYGLTVSTAEHTGDSPLPAVAAHQ